METQTFKYENYVNNIYDRQSENSIRELLSSFAREYGYEFVNVDEIINMTAVPMDYNVWDEPIYTKHGIQTLIQKIIE